MLAVKTTCKDRWRQVMAEADRIAPKHLLTLEAGISTPQTMEMASAQIQLVIPKGIMSSFTPTQQASLISFAQFITLVR
ncbi:MAG: type II restriction endonuclease [Cypionkella sp.]